MANFAKYELRYAMQAQGWQPVKTVSPEEMEIAVAEALEDGYWLAVWGLTESTVDGQQTKTLTFVRTVEARQPSVAELLNAPEY